MRIAKDVLINARRSMERDIKFHEREWLKASQTVQEVTMTVENEAKAVADLKNDLRALDQAIFILEEASR
jgi:hypothetical protein